MPQIEAMKFETQRLKATPQQIDTDSGVLLGTQIMQAGILGDRDLEIDAETLAQVVALGNAAPKGVKCRFGHPSMCSESLGTYLGRYTNFTSDGDTVRADLHLANVSHETPQGDLGAYVLKMATEEPDMLGNSVVVMMRREMRLNEDGTPQRDENGAELVPLMRVEVLEAVDVVDEPAATTAMFGHTPSAFDGLSQATIEELSEAANKPGFINRALRFLSWKSGPRRDVADRSTTEGQDDLRQEKDMEIQDLTVEALRSDRPDLVDALLLEQQTAHSEMLAAASAEALATERERVSKILARAELWHFQKTAEHPDGFAAHAINSGMPYVEALEGLYALNTRSEELLALQSETAATQVAVLEGGGEKVPEVEERLARAVNKIKSKNSGCNGTANVEV